MTDLFDHDTHLCSKQLDNEPFCKQNNLETMKSISLESFALSLALASQFQHQVSVMRELGNGLLVHAFSWAYIELWMHLGSLESTQEARVALGYRLE